MSFIKAWKAKGQILEGLKNKIFKQEHIEEIHDERMAICKACPKVDTKGKNCYVPGTQPCCGACGCSLALKLRSLASGCGDEENPKWGPILDDIEEDMLNDQLDLDEDG